MGDVAMVVPLILALKTQNEGVKITMVSNVFFKPIFQDIQNLDFIAIDTKKTQKGFIGILKIFWQIYQLKPTHFADLHNSLRSKIIGFLLQIVWVKKRTLKKGRKEKKELIANKFFKPLTHTTERYADVMKKLNFNINLDSNFHLNKLNLLEKFKDIFSNHQKIIGVAPFAKHEAKTYPIDLMQNVISKICEDSQNFVFLFGGINERELLEKLCQNFENISVVSSNFQEELALISNLNVMLAMDSGNAHLSAIFGVKTITIWSGTHPFAGFSPYNQPVENYIVPDKKEFPSLPNSIFGNKINDEVKAGFRSLNPDIIIEKLMKE
jgi:ADP-heptose:LPS heptosyltransferase